MHHLKSKNKNCYKINDIIWYNLNLNKLKKKKWIFFKQNLKTKSLKNYYKNNFNKKQQLKSFYGFIPEYIIKKLLKNNFNNFLITLESKLDIILYRLNIVNSIFQAKQLIAHKKIKINSNIINSSNVLLKPGDFIKINNNNYNKIINNKIPKYLEFNNKLNIFIYLRKPYINEIHFPFNINKNIKI